MRLKMLAQKVKGFDCFFSLLVCVFFFICLAAGSPYFFNQQNILSLQASIAPYTMLAAGMMLLIIMGMFDLSVGSVMGFSGIFCAYLLTEKLPVMAAVLLALAAGAAIGALNGILVAYAGISPLIATIGTQFIFRGFCELIMTSELAVSLTGFPAGFLKFGNMRFLGLYPMTWIMLLAVVIFQIILMKTWPGRWFYYIGGNKISASTMGFPVKGMTFLAFTVSGFMSALGGVMSVARSQAASRYLGNGIQVDILIACVVGGGSLLGGKGDAAGALTGTIFLILLDNAFNLFGINSLFKGVVIGGILMLVVTVDGILAMRRMKALGKI
ncbi:MAG: ABC transporter permease [Lachnospiraceae bacterium]|jgi:ribose/xylose/arabinose/galactoside ABC-type transport system permease subunit|nr:ABC transporter permease [Lachnospiraceae bacterium]